MTELPLESFLEEMGDLLADLEAALLALESSPSDGELIGRVFRAFHTIKGLAGMFGFNTLSKFTHEVESVFESVRNGLLTVDSVLVNQLLAAKDHIGALLAACSDTDDKGVGEQLLAELKQSRETTSQVAADENPPLDIGSFLAVLTDYELSRLKANLKEETRLYALDTVYSLEQMESELTKAKGLIKPCGELISAVPKAAAAPPGSCGFTLLFASGLSEASLVEQLGSRPREVDTAKFLVRSAPVVVSPKAAITFRVRFRPSPEILRTGPDPLVLLAELSQLGTCLVVAHTSSIPSLDALDPTLCHVFWDIILTTDKGLNAIRDVFIFVEHNSELIIEEVDDGGTGDGVLDYKRLGEILVERGDLAAEHLDEVLSSQKRLGELLVESQLVTSDKVQSALVEQQHVKKLRLERHSEETGGSVKVPAERLDLLVNLVGELVTVQARLSQLASSSTEGALMSVAEEVERLTTELRDNALSIRMLPIGATFGKFQRLVRDLSRELGKEVEMVTAGAETKLDKTVIEKLSDPLIHLIRNSIDHGIESPETREAMGKPRKGTVRLAAVHSGDSVVITIDDDGTGLDREAIRARAVERGFISPSAEPTEKELFALIFASGFSTSREITSVSGRGVGMDVVKRSIDSLHGTVEISSCQGAGTTIAVRIPLTLAIVESLLVGIGRDRFVLPLALVEECVELTRADVTKAHGRNLAHVRGSIVPYISLREVFDIRDRMPEIQQIIITNLNGERIGFVVDYVIGEHQTVIKSLGRVYRDVAGISGATILGDGSVALILDPPHLARGAEL
jgi:two-component system chemotaxis sensor kinase CheA